jgi:phage-related protein
MRSSERPVTWLKAAWKEFGHFPVEVRDDMFTALTLAAVGGKAEKAKHFTGAGSGVFEIALRHAGNAYRAVYTVEFAVEVIVVDAFQKKSKTGIATPKVDVDRIIGRLRKLREARR